MKFLCCTQNPYTNNLNFAFVTSRKYKHSSKLCDLHNEKCFIRSENEIHLGMGDDKCIDIKTSIQIISKRKSQLVVTLKAHSSYFIVLIDRSDFLFVILIK